ncbi:ABC-F family ATP-binding cassette domain-containing protein [Caulobacter endophyticus]|uniref:ABC-F family ATP-binding cassette domain-containing protein n=1 Tax=Caulobacter endophyticus TaxID=2172652 RepID=UPI00240EA6DB|nr:ABC-F family ATP-binding cassette domain-containing protein [Caulobacter endophyticus]MDG2530556.1 ABC-F family ATP-binding cassette domain-containing protein [Caulobacter endophyticus]
MAAPARAPVLALKDVRLADGAKPLFDGVDLALEPRIRACLVGRNGAGKSTLLKVLAAQGAEPDSGERAVQPGAKVVFVSQEPEITGETLLDYCTAGGAQDYEAHATLADFGLNYDQSTKGLSGGERRRAALARAFAEQPDVLLLDEPTNHLDIFAIQTLEEELANSKCAALIVSHDRAFLNRVTQRTFWLEHRKVRRLDKGFAEFETWSEQVLAAEAEEERRLNKKLEVENAWLARGVQGRRARNEGRRRALLDLRAQKKDIQSEKRGAMSMAVESSGTSGKRVVEAKGLTKKFGERTIVENFSTRILRGDRVALVGPNGAGKTTLVRMLLGEIEADAGTVQLGTNLEIAYVDQNRLALSEKITVWDFLTPSGGDSILVRGVSKHVAGYAKEFLFTEAQLRQPVTSLSGGERNRLLLARALASPMNLMVLDEPTNDLDMDTLDLLEELLADFEGTLILVSHDRDFIDRLATSTIAMNGHGDVLETPGGWTDLIDQAPDFFKGARGAAGDFATGTGSHKAVVTPAAAPPKKATKLSYKDQRRLEECEALIADSPKILADLEKKLDDPNLYARDPAGFDKIMKALDKARADLAQAEEDWLMLEEKKEALAG